MAPNDDGKRAGSVTEEAIEKIRERITSGAWGPGTRLPREADLAAQLGLSRSSLREAVRALSLVRVLEVRQRGFMCGIELAGFPVEARMGHQVTLEARRRGVIVRPLGDVVVLMPPLAIGERELRELVEVVGGAIEAATAAHRTATPLAA